MHRGRPDVEVGRRVASLVWDPLGPHLAAATTVLVSPDGDLCFLPWGALPGPASGERLLRKWAFAVVPSGRQLLALAAPSGPPARGGLLVAGGVDYGDPGSSAAEPAEPAWSSFGPLPATEVEGSEVTRLFRARLPGRADGRARPGRRHRGQAGRRDARTTRPPPGDARLLRPAAIGGRGGLIPPVVGGPGSLRRRGTLSRLALGAGLGRGVPAVAERPGAGLMTAEEVSGLDLKGCELAVLSACETGLGRAAGGEGVLGLQRSFHRAGCRTVVASLWRVDDGATLELMRHFYADLWTDKLPRRGPPEAQLALLDQGRGPMLWAGWALSGDPGGLSRANPAVTTGR